MKIIKLSAIDSTNSFLKDLALNNVLEDYTIVITDHQTKGRGQMETHWESEPFKNLTFSVFTTLNNLEIRHQSYLNFAISLAVYEVLKNMSVSDLYIKWPNDIMADNKKLCGILIETTFKKNRIKNSIIGIGLNVNQEKFSNGLLKVTSLKLEQKREFDLEKLMRDIVLKIKFYIQKLEVNDFEWIHKAYLKALYKKGKPMTFLDSKTNQHFMGIIVNVDSQGKLIVQLEDDSFKEYDTKEISFATT